MKISLIKYDGGVEVMDMSNVHDAMTLATVNIMRLMLRQSNSKSIIYDVSDEIGC